MFKGKCRLAIATALTLCAMPLLAAETAAEPENREEDRRNPALPSPDDLVSFEYSAPTAKVTLDVMGANQRAFPLFYGAPAANPGTLIAATPTSGLDNTTAQNQATNNDLIETGQPIHYGDGIVTRTYVSVPVPATPEAVQEVAREAVREAAPEVAAAATPSLRPQPNTLPSLRPAEDSALQSSQPTLASLAGKENESSESQQTSVAAAMPHAGAGKGENAPPTLGTTIDADTKRLAAAPEQSAPVAAASATLAMATAPTDASGPNNGLTGTGDAPQTSSARPIRPVPETAIPQTDTATAALSDARGFTPGAKDSIPDKAAIASLKPPANDKPLASAEPAFPMTSISPPPIPMSGSPMTGMADSHPTVGLAEFRGGKALDGTPLPPPPPMPERLPERPKEVVAVKVDPAQVRADFNRLKAFCEEDSLGSAAEIYAHMPDFGDDEEINRLRADAANLLILGLARNDNLRAARRIFDSVPVGIAGYDANLAKTRGIINLATYYVRAERFNDAFDVLMELNEIENRSTLNNELFRLMARMIPYLDNADETEKSAKVYDMLVAEIKSPGTATLFADNIQGVLKYFLHYVDRSENPVARRKRMDFLEHMYSSLEMLKDNPEIRLVRGTVGMSLADRYSGDPDRAAKFLEN